MYVPGGPNISKYKDRGDRVWGVQFFCDRSILQLFKARLASCGPDPSHFAKVGGVRGKEEGSVD